jgi:hypothetical protein
MEAYLVIGILIFMASLLFCKSLLECVQALMHVLAQCSGCAGNCECVSLKPCYRFQNIAIISVIPDMVKAGYRG